MRLEWFRLSAVILTTVLEPDLTMLERRQPTLDFETRTWTSFSPRETRLTMLARDTLSGLGLRWYSASRIA